MANLQFKDVSILGMSGAVPKHTIVNRNYTAHFDKDTVGEIIDKTGVEERRFAPDGMTSSDLCFAAATKLIDD